MRGFSDGEGVLALSESQGARLLRVWRQKVTCRFLPQVSRRRRRRGGGADVTFGTFTLPGPATEAEGSPQSVFFFFFKPLLSRNIAAQLWRTTCVCYSVYVHHSSHLGVKAAAGGEQRAGRRSWVDYFL